MNIKAIQKSLARTLHRTSFTVTLTYMEPARKNDEVDLCNTCLDSQPDRPIKRTRITKDKGPLESVVSSLTPNDRKKALEIMREIKHRATGIENDDVKDQMLELQRMLLLNVKAEIQTVDNHGDLTDWLDSKLRKANGL